MMRPMRQRKRLRRWNATWSEMTESLRHSLSLLVRSGAAIKQPCSKVAGTSCSTENSSKGVRDQKTNMKKLIPVVLAAFVFAGCDSAEEDLIEERSENMQEALDQQKEVLNDATEQAKDAAEGNDQAQDVLEQQQEATQDAIEQQKDAVEDAAEAAKDRVD